MWKKWYYRAQKGCYKVPRSGEYDVRARQPIKSTSSVAADYRASQRGKSTADFIDKLKIVVEKADESVYWLELFPEVMHTNHGEMQRLEKKAGNYWQKALHNLENSCRLKVFGFALLPSPKFCIPITKRLLRHKILFGRRIALPNTFCKAFWQLRLPQ